MLQTVSRKPADNQSETWTPRNELNSLTGKILDDEVMCSGTAYNRNGI